MRLLSCDVETFSETKLKDAGLHRYIDDPSFEVMLLAYSYDYEPATIIDLKAGESIPPQLLHDLTDPAITKCAWNAAFERNALEHLTGLYMPPEQWRDTMILSASCGLPLSLDGASKALSLPEDKAKMQEGKNLIKYFCVPCKPTKRNPDKTRRLPEDAPERWATFKDYCCRDVEAESYIHKLLSAFEPDETEHKAWCQDQRINDRGVRLDMQMVRNAIRFDEINKAALIAEASELTGMDNPTSVAQIKEWLLKEEGIEVESLNKKAMPDVLDSLQSDTAKHFLTNLRAEFSKASTAKYKAMERCVCSDGRAKGLFQFFGARTARWCLAEGSPVLVKTLRGIITEKPIESVSEDDLVWDGDNWVEHEGVMFSGDKDVITWDGITATPTHYVWINPDDKITLEEAKEKGIPLWRGNIVRNL